MANFFTDNADFKYYLDDPRLEEITNLREKGYSEHTEFPFAPEDFNDAKDSHQRVLSLAGQIAAETLAPGAADVDLIGCRLEENRVILAPNTRESLKRFGQADLLGMTLPRKYGGLNLTMTLLMMTTEMVARADAGFMTLFGLQGIAETIYEFADEEIKARYLPKLCSGEYTGAMALTEPEAGSDLQAIRLKATFDEAAQCWRLSGVKHFITNGCGDVLLVLARSEANIPDGRGLSMFICEKGESLRVRRIEDKLGIHGSPTCELQFKNCRATLIGQRKRGLTRYVMHLMNGARLAIAAQGIGLAQAAYEQAYQYAQQRKQFAKAISRFPAVADMLSMMQVRIEAARSLLYEASLMVDLQYCLEHAEDKDTSSRQRLKKVSKYAALLTPMLKYYATEMCNRVAYDALQVFGGYGFMRDYEIERIYRDARITTIYEGTSQLQVVGATGGIMSGLFFKLLSELPAHNEGAIAGADEARLNECEAQLKATVDLVKGQGDLRFTEFHAGSLMDMAVELLMGRLLIKQAQGDDHKTRIAKRYVAHFHPRNRMLSERIRASDPSAIADYGKIVDTED